MSENPDMSNDRRRWVVFGASGFVGGNLVRALEDRHVRVLRVPAPRVEINGSLSVEQLLRVLPRYQREIDAVAMQLLPDDIVVNAAGIAEPDSPGTERLFGANALLPGILAAAANKGRAKHFIHLSSAAVQGNARVLDTAAATRPFSPYSASKALGESLVRGLPLDIAATILRATSVQGRDRKTTRNLQSLARSPLASVAAPGTQPTSVSSISGLLEYIIRSADAPKGSLTIDLQPWEGGTVSSVLTMASGGKPPLVLPAALCRIVIAGGRVVSSALGGRIAGHVRRLELMWFGQAQDSSCRQLVNSGFMSAGLSYALSPQDLATSSQSGSVG